MLIEPEMQKVLAKERRARTDDAPKTTVWRVKVEWLTESPFAQHCEPRVLKELYAYEPALEYFISHVEEFCFDRYVFAEAFKLKIEAYYAENPVVGKGDFGAAVLWSPVVTIEEIRD